MNIRTKKLTQYVVPTILGNCAYFLFTIIDGIFVGQGIGTNALGAINLVCSMRLSCSWSSAA